MTEQMAWEGLVPCYVFLDDCDVGFIFIQSTHAESHTLHVISGQERCSSDHSVWVLFLVSKLFL